MSQNEWHAYHTTLWYHAFKLHPPAGGGPSGVSRIGPRPKPPLMPLAV